MDAHQDAETRMTGGWVTAGVVRVGDTVRRPTGGNAAFVHRLLEHLAEMGFETAPRFLGVDEQGREILTFIEGEVSSDCATMIWGDDQLVAAASLLRRFHAATAGHAMAAGAEAVCHNDFGPWNLVWKDDMPVGIIDFDEAAPGPCLDDLGYSIWKHLNLGLVNLSPSEQGRRLKADDRGVRHPLGRKCPHGDRESPAPHARLDHRCSTELPEGESSLAERGRAKLAAGERRSAGRVGGRPDKPRQSLT